MWVHPVDWVILWVQRVLKMELGVLQHPLYDVFYVDRLRHVWRGHDVESGQTGICRLGDPLHYQVPPKSLLIFSIMVLKKDIDYIDFYSASATPVTFPRTAAKKKQKREVWELTWLIKVVSLDPSWIFFSRMFRSFTNLSDGIYGNRDGYETYTWSSITHPQQ